MKLNEVIRMVDDIKPNAFGDEAKTAWINECEGMVQTQIMLIAPADIIQYEYEKDAETELLAAPPHNKIYWAYLTAMVDFANGEYNKYQNTMQVFNAYFGEYMRWYARVYQPANGQMEVQGYYLSAYSIAVKHGFEGTEDEWLETLKGERGEQGAGFVIKGYFDTFEQLQAEADPKQGDFYGVGTEAPYTIYAWDAVKGWVDNGQLKGDPGAAATIRIGSVSEGEQASVVNSGTENAAVLDFVLQRGKQGEQGIQGETGAPFTYDMFTPEQLEDLRGKPGADGSDGVDGKDGAAATVAVGTVTTLPANSPATVENVGTANAAVLNFGIPKGKDGEGGGGGGDMYKATYDANDDGIVDKADDALKLNGKTDADFAPAIHGHQAEQVTFADGQTFQQKYDAGELRGQQGEPGKDGVGTPGKDGADGAPGAAATITVGSVTTGAAGTSASVVNAGTANAAVFNFTIPRGADGGKGDPGYTPQKGVDYYTAADKQEIVNLVLANFTNVSEVGM